MDASTSECGAADRCQLRKRNCACGRQPQGREEGGTAWWLSPRDSSQLPDGKAQSGGIGHRRRGSPCPDCSAKDQALPGCLSGCRVGSRAERREHSGSWATVHNGPRLPHGGATKLICGRTQVAESEQEGSGGQERAARGGWDPAASGSAHHPMPPSLSSQYPWLPHALHLPRLPHPHPHP